MAEIVAATSEENIGAEENSTENGETSFRGYLEKEGHLVNTGFKKRFFVLSKSGNKWSMGYFVDDGQGRVGDKKGEVELKGSVTKGELESDFDVVSKERCYKLRAETPDLAQSWIERIKNAITENESATLAAVVAAGKTFRGVLEKQGHFLNTSYKARLFVLAQQPNGIWTLSYYVDEGQGRLGELKGEINLKGASLEAGLLFDFTVATKDKTYPLRANEAEMATQWKEKIQEAIDASNAN